MKSLKGSLSLLLMFAIMFVSSSNTHAASAGKTKVLLQINEYHVLYTYPKEPYIDKNQRLMIPLRSISKLLGGSVTYDAITKEASIKMGTNLLKVTANSKDMDINGVTRTMDTAPVIVKQSLFVPIRVLIDNMGLKAIRDSNTGILKIESESIDRFSMIKSFKEFDISPERIASADSIVPLSYNLTLNEGDKTKLTEGEITIFSKNVSGGAILEGKEDLHVVFLFNSTISTEPDGGHTDHPDRSRPALSKDQQFQRKVNFSSGIYGENLKYILAIGRTFK